MSTLEQYAENIWTLLVDKVGAREDDRLDFVLSVCATEYPCSEYRFGGNFGFGGKCYLNQYTREARIGYHPQDVPSREKAQWEHTVNVVNAQIQEFYQQYAQSMAALSAGPSAP